MPASSVSVAVFPMNVSEIESKEKVAHQVRLKQFITTRGDVPRKRGKDLGAPGRLWSILVEPYDIASFNPSNLASL